MFSVRDCLYLNIFTWKNDWENRLNGKYFHTFNLMQLKLIEKDGQYNSAIVNKSILAAILPSFGLKSTRSCHDLACLVGYYVMSFNFIIMCSVTKAKAI